MKNMNWRKPVILLLSKLQGSKRLDYYNQILANSQASKKKLQALQQQKLQRILLHASQHVPYYAAILQKSGVVKDGTVVLEKFTNIPPLTKDILKEKFDELLSDDHQSRRSFTNHSGGSTGEPTTFVQDSEYDDWNIGNKLYYKHVVGQEIGESELRLWGSEKDFMGAQENLTLRFRNYIFNRKEINAFTMTPENMSRYVDIINNFKPKLMECYVDAIYYLSLFVESNKLNVHSPNAIITSAGTLYPHMKQKIEEVFSTRVWNRYGSREVGDIAFGDEQLELSVWNHYVEIEGERGSVGKILVTTLNNYSMPLIRYDIGDIGRLGEEWGILQSVEGREVEAFKTRDGGVVPGLLFVHFLGVVMNDGTIKQFQMIQKSVSDIHVRVVVTDPAAFKDAKSGIEKLINQAMGYACTITWFEVDEIPKLPNGKYLYTMSKVT